MPRVLIGFAEALGAIESAWCLADAGFEVVAFGRAGRRPPLASSRAARVVPVPPPEIDASATVAAVRALLAEDPAAIVLPLDDHAVWLSDRLAREPGPAPRIAGPTGARARLALDKREQVEAAEKAGFAVPATGIAGADLPGGPGPWMVKSALATVPRDGRLWRPAGAVATSAAEVDRIAAAIGAPALVQQLVTGIGEGVFGFAVDGEVLALSAHRRVRMMNPRGSGSSACRSIPVDPELVGPTRRFLADAGWHGIFMVELLRDGTGRPWFMELNGRAWGSMALAVRRGLPYPEWAVRAVLDPDQRPVPPTAPPDLICRHLGREIVHFLAVMRGAPSDTAEQWPSRLGTLRAMLRRERGTRWYHYRRGELPVLLRDTWTTVTEQVRRRRG